MEVPDRSRSPSRRTSRVEQMVGRWLRRSQDTGSRSHSLSRDRVSADGKTAESGGCDRRNYPFRFNVQIQWDPNLNSHGLTLSSQTPILVQEVTPGGPADGRLAPGDQLVKINNVAVDDLTPEQAAEIIRECQDTLAMTVLRTILGPKSSFITPEKRAKLRSNPVKVRFAEEVEVNGHTQGNSLLFLPNVLKVYLENGQTKAFKFEPSTTVKDIVMTLKEKLSLNRIEHFSLALEQQHSISKLLLLHDEERIQQVVQKKEAHDYRCLFRVCFMPRNLQTLLQEDPTAFEYLYLQGVNDVLQERFAVEMKCNTALHLAALHIQERLASCGQSAKTSLKTIMKTWGIENFVSSTLLRNMREKDLRKAISYHMKKSQSQHDPRQKGLSVDQARINYLEELSDLKSFGGKSFSATMMLQDRESMVTLLVGARYGVSQIVNHKLSILSTLTEFTSITRIELLPESDKVSLVKIYLQDIKPITLLLEAMSAKDMSCLIAGYCRVFVDPNLNILPWIDDSKKHRVSAEEGYVSRCGSDSDNSSDLDMESLLPLVSHDGKSCPRVRPSSGPEGSKKKDRDRRRSKDGKEKGGKHDEEKKQKGEKDADIEKEKILLDKNGDKDEDTEKWEETERAQDSGQKEIEITDNDSGKKGGKVGQEGKIGGGEEGQAAEEQPSVSEASDSCHTDSRVLTSPSSDSLDALEEDDLLLRSSSSIHPSALTQTHLHIHFPLQLHPYSHKHIQPHFLAPPPAHSHPLIHLTTHDRGGEGCRRSGDGADPQLFTSASSSPSLHHVQKCTGDFPSDDSSICFAELSRLVDFLPSPPEASEDDEDTEQELRRRRRRLLKEMVESMGRAGEGGSVNKECDFFEHPLSLSPSSPSSHMEFVFNFDQSDTRCYYKLCSNITPDSAHSLPRPLHYNKGEDCEDVDRDEDKAEDLESAPILQPPPGFGDSSSDEEFFDARDRFTSPEDPSSGSVPRDISTEMKLDFLSTISLSDIKVSMTHGDKDRKGDEEGRGRETLFQLRKRSRKRRSFMETNYTSMVSYPEPDSESKRSLVSKRLHKNFLAQVSDAQMLGSDPEPSDQTQNPSPTVSSLTHSEGEPAQLELKPILSKLHSHGPGSPSGCGSHGQTRDPQVPAKSRKQEMEMEPDTMESKSVTDLVMAVCPAITIVRCRVDPDGKESADQCGDRKEEREGQEGMGEGKEVEKEETAGVSRDGPFTSHMFLPEVTEEDKGEDTQEERIEGVTGYSSQTPLLGTERQPEANMMPTCLIGVDKTGSSGSLRFNLFTQELNSYEEDPILDGVCDKSNLLSSAPPAPPPSSPLPAIPVPHKENGSDNMEILTKMSLSNSEEMLFSKQNCINESQLHLDVAANANDEDATGVVSSAVTTSDDVTDSTNSDDVFEDDEVCNSLNSSSTDKKDDWTLATKHSIQADSVTVGKDESQMSIKSPPDTEVPTRIHSVNFDYRHAINSVTAKLGAATSITSPTFNPDPRLKSEAAHENTLCSNKNVDKARSESTMPSVEPKDSLASPSLVTGIHNLSKQPPSPSHFLFQTCSPCIMGRLSASTLREKIQNLPLYLSRSHETLNGTGVDNVPHSPFEDNNRDNIQITIKVLDVHDATQTVDSEKGTTAESVESDDSDTTVTGSEVDEECFVVTTSAISFHKGSEVKEVSSAFPVQAEPKSQHQNQLLHSGPIKNTPGPITVPPASIVNSMQRDISGLKINTPGPIIDSPESTVVTAPGDDIPDYKMSNQSLFIPPPVVVTTQNLNGPGLPFYNQSQKARWTSSDRPLIGLCRPSEQNSNSPETLSSGCRVFTICEGPSQTKTTAEAGTASHLKSQLGCSSVLASGCEPVVEGVQVPLDACGCPAVYTNCFSGGDSFDDELTIYEFSCRTQSSDATQTSGTSIPLITSPPVPSFLPTSTTHSPSFPRSLLFSSCTSELSPLLSPLSDTSDCFLSQMHKDTISQLGQQHYPEPPAGFQVLRVDVDQLLSILESSGADQSVIGHGGRHPRDTCPAHFTENKRVLQIEARRLMSGCQKIVGIGQSPEEMLYSLADSFQTLVGLAVICLWFSGCDRCDQRNTEVVAGLADVARSFRDFCLAAERVSSKRSCQDLSTKLLAKQCTALTASVFCLTQLFRTLTAL